jgi:nucleoside-diphosphate-sugar epimerase
VLVTGATGFVGSHLARRLVGLGSEVHVLVRPNADPVRLGDLQSAIILHVADMRAPEDVTAVVAAVRPDRVFHLAAAAMHAGRSPEADEQVTTNLRGAVALMDACQDLELEAFVNVGDAFEYGPGDGPVAETATANPISLDGITKLAATLYGCALARLVGLPVVTIRPFSIVGLADDPRRLVPRMVETARTGTTLALSDRSIVRDFVAVDDVVEMLARAAEGAVALRGQVLNCGSGKATTLADLVDAVERVTGTAVDADWGAFPVAEHDLHHPVADVSAAERALGWRATTTLDGMIEQLWGAGGSRQSSRAGSERSR